MQSNSPLGLELAEYVNKGEIAPGELASRVLRERLSRPDAKNGVIVDGFPRISDQADMFDVILADLGTTLSHVILLDMSDEVSISRLEGRRVCTNAKCGTNYHLIAIPPKVDGICDLCGSSLHARPDDVPAIVARRLAIYHTETEPLIERYQTRGILHRIDAARNIGIVFADVLKDIA